MISTKTMITKYIKSQLNVEVSELKDTLLSDGSQKWVYQLYCPWDQRTHEMQVSIPAERLIDVDYAATFIAGYLYGRTTVYLQSCSTIH